jgi:hypothetical protein
MSESQSFEEFILEKEDPLHGWKGVDLVISFSNAFSNTDDYAQSCTNVGEIKRQ